MKRPKGVTAIAVSFFVGATILPALVLLAPKYVTVLAKSMLMMVSLIEFVLALGLWKMRNWARVCTAVLVIISLLSVVASLLHGSVWLRFAPWRLAEYALVVAIDSWILIYLLSPAVRHAFCKGGVL